MTPEQILLIGNWRWPIETEDSCAKKYTQISARIFVTEVQAVSPHFESSKREGRSSTKTAAA